MIERAMRIRVCALEELNDLLGAFFLLRFGFAHFGVRRLVAAFSYDLSRKHAKALTSQRTPNYGLFNFPVSISASIFQSPMNDQSG